MASNVSPDALSIVANDATERLLKRVGQDRWIHLNITGNYLLIFIQIALLHTKNIISL